MQKSREYLLYFDNGGFVGEVRRANGLLIEKEGDEQINLIFQMNVQINFKLEDLKFLLGTSVEEFILCNKIYNILSAKHIKNIEE